MSSPDRTISYASPPGPGAVRWFLHAFRRPLAFWTAAVSTAVILRAIAVLGPLRDWNSYLGPELSLAIDVVAMLVGLWAATLAIEFLILLVEWLRPRVTATPAIVFWIASGIFYGLACTVPHIIDLALSDGGTRVDGDPVVNSWGTRVELWAYGLLPLLTVVVSLRRAKAEG